MIISNMTQSPISGEADWNVVSAQQQERRLLRQ